MENSKRPGRKQTKEETNDKAKGYNVSLKPSVKKRIEDKFGSLSKALKFVLNQIPNPAAFTLKKD